MKSKRPIITNYRDKEAAEAQAAFLEANRGAAARMRAEEKKRRASHRVRRGTVKTWRQVVKVVAGLALAPYSPL